VVCSMRGQSDEASKVLVVQSISNNISKAHYL
jgi:hypothetical protein